MKLASLRNASRDGCLMVVDRALTRMAPASAVAPTMRDLLDDWEGLAPALRDLAARLEAGRVADEQPFDPVRLLAPLPRAFGWIDGTSYLSHMERARALRGAVLPDDFRHEPLMTERISVFLGPRDDLPLASGEAGLDFEGEVGVILGDVPVGMGRTDAACCIRLVTLVNDVSLRTVLADAIRRGRSATLAAKPYPGMAPVAVTPDELGMAWDGDILRGIMQCRVNGELLAAPDAGKDASFGFPQLIAYSAAHRPLPAGTVLAAGTVSNADDDLGGACIAERRLIEQRRSGVPVTPYLEIGDLVRIEMLDGEGCSFFGAIEQAVVAG